MNIIITAGGTSEKIDNVRKITNSGSGKLGFIIANKLIDLYNEKINTIYYVCSKSSFKPVHKKIKIIEITDTKNLEMTIISLLKGTKQDYFIHTMAVSDYTVDYVTTAEKLTDSIKENSDILNSIVNYDKGIKDTKISSNEDNLIIKLKRTPKIISIIKSISPSTFLVGFKLLDNVSREKLLDTAIKLRDKNKCDLVVANDLNTIRNGAHQAYIIRSDNSYMVALSKDDIAEKIIEEMHID